VDDSRAVIEKIRVAIAMTSIIDIMAHGESETLEFKERFSTEVIEVAVAFANTKGGRVVIGVSDAGKPIAQTFGKEALRDYVNRIATATEPTVIPEAEKHSTPEGEIIVLSVNEFPLKPIATRGRCYRRAGSTTRQMSPAEIAEMHLHSTGQSMDAIIVAGKIREDLDLEAVQNYMRQAPVKGRRAFPEQEDPWQVLKKLELVKSEAEITRAAVLLFGKNPQSPLTQAVVHAGRFREKVHIMDNRIIDGSIIDQVDETMEFIKKNLHVRFEITGAPARKEIWDYPLVALREAVTNAICHRDYGDVADIQIKIFEDTLQIWSPGFLPYNMTVEDLLDPEHTSKPRNKLIAQIFYDLGLIERYGSGIRRILDDCGEANLPEPLFENFSGGFRIKFLAVEMKRDASPETVMGQVPLNVPLNQLILDLIMRNPGVQRKDLATALNVTEKTIGRYLATLIAEGKVERRGSKKTGGYWLREKP
jgi:ATP-dependent DNA helicase RecG